MRKQLLKKVLSSIMVLLACLLVAATPLPPVPGTEEPGETVEAGGGETELGIEPQSDDDIDKLVDK